MEIPQDVFRNRFQDVHQCPYVSGMGYWGGGGGIISEERVEISIEDNFVLISFDSLWIGAQESIPPAYVAWRTGTTTLYLLGS